MSLKAKIEAVLFLTSKPIKAQAIARIVNADVQAVRQAILELVHDYEERQCGLEIADDDGYTFQVREQYASLMDEFLPIEMSAALIRTLSAIAIKQPISQSEIIRVRGAGAYDHIRELVIKGLVAKKEEQGERSPNLSTTKKFQEYFKLTKDGKDLRNYLKKQVKKADAAEADEKQLVIPEMVAAETDDQLNQRIYLETAEYGATAGDDDKADVPVVDVPLVDVPVVAAPLVDVSIAEVPIIEVPMVESPAEAIQTLSKLAEIAEEAHEPVVPETTKPSSVQANNAKRKEPKIANNPPVESKKPKNKPMPGSLMDLVEKQKFLEKQLKLGVIEELVVEDDFLPPTPNTPSQADSQITE